MKKTAVIMAGGRGERFWPQSRTTMPKQFLSLTADGETMIQKTAARIAGIAAIEDTFVVTNQNYVSLVQEQLPELPKENILAEPVARNTAPCIALAAAVIKKKYGDAVMIVLPSDHLIKFQQMYLDTLKKAVFVAEQGKNLVTIGITPTCPETGYGYIHIGSDAEKEDGVYVVKEFVEKPGLETAKGYFNSGEYLWNSGMFVWKASSFLENMLVYLPEMREGLERLEAAVGTPEFEAVVKQEFPKFRSKSVDVGVMEKAADIFAIPGNFGWDDVGSWLALERINRTNEYGNMIRGDVITINTTNSIAVGNKKLIAMVGIKDLIVVDTDDAVLICGKDSTQNVKQVIENLKICNRNELL